MYVGNVEGITALCGDRCLRIARNYVPTELNVRHRQGNTSVNILSFSIFCNAVYRIVSPVRILETVLGTSGMKLVLYTFNSKRTALYWNKKNFL
jgi:hypothetical protein